MNPHLKEFALQWLRVAAMAVAPVVLTAFASMPVALERHPGEAAMASERFQGHMT